MSTKFEQLLDYLVNEEMDKANELFHEIVVEKSREIYENLIAEEEDEEEMDEAKAEDEQDESVEEAAEDEEEMDEGADEELEDSYMMDADDDSADDMMGGDAADDSLDDIEMNGDSEDEAIMDIKNAIAELEAAFADLQAAQDGSNGDEMDDEFGDEMDDEFGDEEDDANEMMGMVREYRETVAKPSGDVAGANTGDKMTAASATKSPISSGKGKPTTGATAGNIVAKSDTANEDGTSPKGKVGGLVKQGGKFVGNNTLNVDNAQTGIKKLAKVSKPADAEGHAAGAGTGDNSVKGATNTKSVVDHKIG